VVALIGLSALLVSQAEAQAIGGGQSGAAVTVDNSVLEQLGPPPVAKAPGKTAPSIHLIPPKSRLANAAPKSSRKTSHQKATIRAPTKPAVAALAAPVPAASALKQSASSDSPTTPVVPQQARDEAPPAPVAPPSEPKVTARAATPAPMPAPSSTATPASPAAMTAAPTPGTTVAPTEPAAGGSLVQMAAATTLGNAAMTVKFKPGVTDLGGGAQPVLDTVASRLLANQELRLQLISHATGGADDAMEARRVSLARAVAVRAYLIDKGVRSLRIDVRALGNRANNGPVADQVDLVVVSQ